MSSYLPPDVAQLMAARMRGDRPHKRIRHPRLKHSKRYEVFKRDGHRCLQCGATEALTIDHIVPFSKGGSSRQENLQTLCLPCNQTKADRDGAS